MDGSAYPRPFADYVLLERLGVGGMSQVDLAKKAVDDAEFTRFVVIKRIKAERLGDDQFVRMFKDEARITSELHHTNIAHVYDFGRYGDEYYLALEFVPGVDLRTLINTLRTEDRRIPLRIALRVLCDVLAGLGYAHGKVDTLGRNMNIVHRDVNPRNIMLSVRGETKLIDFGVAKATHRLEETRTDHVKGKVAYMAPEQLSGEAIDHRADLFAVGLTLFEIINGYGPFYKLNQVQVMHRLIAGQVPDLPKPAELDDPKHLFAVYQKAVHRNPRHRYQSAAEFRSDLEKVAIPLGGLATEDEIVAFLQDVDPALHDRILDKVTTYAGKLLPSQIATVPMPTLEALLEPDDSMSGPTPVHAPPPEPPPPRRRGLGTWLVLGGTALVLLFAVASLVTALVVVVWPTGVNGPRPSVSDIVPDPAPVPVPEPDSAIAPAPEIEPEREIEPRPAPAVVIPAPEPAPLPKPTTSGPTGTLQITGPDAGMAILIDGEDTGQVTPATFDWAVGTYTVEVGGQTRSVTVREGMITLAPLK